jgi:hypothetical protein
LSANALRYLSIDLEQAGYDSVLLTFHSESPDYLIKSAAALIPGNKLKYMIALRPYHISPQYCAMLTEGYNQVDRERLIFNWVAGDFHNRADEPHQVDVFGSSEQIDDIVKRTTFLRNFIGQYNSYKFVSTKPEMVFSGFSEYTLETAKIFNGTSLCMIDDYRNNIKRFDGIVNRMVCVNPIVLKSEEVEDYKQKILSIDPRSMHTTIIGDKETVMKKLIELKNEGITDILLDTNLPGMLNGINRNNDILVNDIVREINNV